MKKVYIYGGIIVVVLAVAGYMFLGNGQKNGTTVVGQVQRVATIARGNLNLTVSANGVVQPINKVEIRSKAGGQILALNFEEGSFVQKGDLLVIVDTTQTKNEYEQAKADLASATQAVTQAENNSRRSRELYEKKLISDQESDQSKVDFVRAQTQLVRAKAALSTAEDKLRDTRVLAPITGVILSRSVDLGQIIASAMSNVGGGTVLATVADMEEVYVNTNVDEVDIGKVAVGQRASVVADAYPDDTFTGEVLRISPLGKTTQSVTTFNVVVLVRNIGGKLKAGMSASVDIEIFRRQNVVVVPNEALKDPKSEQGIALLASMKKDTTAEKPAEVKTVAQEVKKDDSDLTIEQLRTKMQTATGEDRDRLRQLLREKFQKMTPEERQKMFSQMGGRPGGGQGGGGGMFFGGGGGMRGEPGGDAGQRQRRQSQVSSVTEVKERVVVVKEGVEFVPRLIKIGASNFDVAEVVSGLNEGDEIQITTISRAKLAAEQMNDRMRSMSGLGGMSGGRGAPSGGGRH